MNKKTHSLYQNFVILLILNKLYLLILFKLIFINFKRWFDRRWLSRAWLFNSFDSFLNLFIVISQSFFIYHLVILKSLHTCRWCRNKWLNLIYFWSNFVWTLYLFWELRCFVWLFFFLFDFNFHNFIRTLRYLSFTFWF